MNTWSYTSFHNFGPNNQTRLNHQQLINFAVTGFNQFRQFIATHHLRPLATSAWPFVMQTSNDMQKSTGTFTTHTYILVHTLYTHSWNVPHTAD